MAESETVKELTAMWARCTQEKGRCDHCPKDGRYCAWSLAQITKDALVKTFQKD